MAMDFKNRIAVLLTCHNRKEKTLSCLLNLFTAQLLKGYKIEVFLVDDGSTDGTWEAVSDNFPNVNVIKGSGDLFWNQGMRLAWKTAAKRGDYDFYLWLNDDTLLDASAVEELLICNQLAIKKSGNPAIITGACRIKEGISEFSYGGQTDSGVVIPNGEIQGCNYINGNAVLIPNEIFKKIGNLSSDYTHGMGDFDYGLRAIQNGFNCYTTRKYIAIYPLNEGVQGWSNPMLSLRKRWELFNSPKGLNIKEYLIFRKKFWKYKWWIFALKAYARVFSPRFYSKLQN